MSLNDRRERKTRKLLLINQIQKQIDRYEKQLLLGTFGDQKQQGKHFKAVFSPGVAAAMKKSIDHSATETTAAAATTEALLGP